MQFSYGAFNACLDQIFTLRQNDASEELRLIQVDRLEQAHAAEGREAFSIVFESVSQQALPQKIYALSHPELGEFELFIVPIGQDANGTRYEAVFS